MKTGLRASVLLFAWLLPLVCLHPAFGQAQLPASSPTVPALRQYIVPPEGLIHLDVAVTNADGRPVSGFLQKDFTLLDNGLPQKIVSFRSSTEIGDPNARLSEVILVLDQVYLSPVQFDLAKQEAVQFLQQNGGKLSIPVSIYWFRRTGLFATAAASGDGNALAGEIAHDRAPRQVWEIPQPRAGDIYSLGNWASTLWDSALRTVYTIAIEHRELTGRKVLIWMGPGWHANSWQYHDAETAFDSLIELSTRIREARLAICQIPPPVDPTNATPQPFDLADPKSLVAVRSVAELKKDPQLFSDHVALPALTLQSGGVVIYKASKDEIGDCLRSARNFYTLSFNPAKTSQIHEFHELKVVVPDVTTRTSTGYYDEPVFYNQPRIPTRRITVLELEQMLEGDSKEHDGELAEQLAGIELTERLSSPTLAHLESSLGSKAKAALIGLADQSAFLDPPAADSVAEAAPSAARQQEMIAKTGEYLKNSLSRLPDFYATRTTVEYEQPWPKESDPWETALSDQSLRAAVTVKATLRYRKNREEQDTEKRKGSSAGKLRDLNLIGVFGPMLNSVLTDATGEGNSLTWSRWEKSAPGKVAVFRYDVRGKSPFYGVMDCCLKGRVMFRATPPYHGQIAIDPETGAVLRLTMESEPGWIVEPNLHPVQPVLSTSTMIEYASVQIGTGTYIVPQRSVLMVRSRPVLNMNFWGEPFEIYSSYESIVDDFSYSGYHKFGSMLRILPGFEEVPPATPPQD